MGHASGYMNSSAAIKAFTGTNDGAICTSSNAATAMRWSFEQRDKLLFLPDQHLGRNTAVQLGLDLDDCVVWDPHRDEGSAEAGHATAGRLAASRPWSVPSQANWIIWLGSS